MRLLSILVLLLILPSPASGAEAARFRVGKEAARIRKGPSTEEAIVATARPGTLLQVAERSGDWIRVRGALGVGGWVRADLGSIVGEPPASGPVEPGAARAGRWAFLYASPKVEGDPVGQLYESEPYRLAERRAPWAHVEGRGWVLEPLLRDWNPPALPSPSPRSEAAPSVLPSPPAASRPPTPAATLPPVEPTPSPPASAVPEEAAVRQVPIGEAMARGVVRARFTATGAVAGDTVLLEAANPGDRELSLSIPPGLLLREPGAERLLTVARLRGFAGDDLRYVTTEGITLGPGGKGRFLLEAYALVPGKPPAPGAVLEPAAGTSEEARRFFLGALGGAKTRPDPAAVQAALWAILADVTRADVERNLRMTDPDYATARWLLEISGWNPAATRLFR